MTKDVSVRICGVQNGPDADGETMEFVTTGEYFYKNNKHYILYEETMEGETTVSKNRIKISGGKLELQKSGPVSTHMIFEEGQKALTDYMTPYGNLQMGIDSSAVEITHGEDEISIRAEYALEMNGEHAADCRIEIMIQSL